MSELPVEILFEVDTPLGFSVRVGRLHWEFLVAAKHPAMSGREDDVRIAISHPDEVRRSRKAATCYYSIKERGIAAGFVPFVAG